MKFPPKYSGGLPPLDSALTYFKFRFLRRPSNTAVLPVSDVQRMKALEDENPRIKRLVADMLLENTAIKDVLSKKVVTPNT